MNDILSVNTHLKYVEFLLDCFDNESEDKTIGELRNDFKKKFSTLHPLLNQNFGIYRLVPLILIKEDYKNSKKELKGDIKKIKIIRDALVHHGFEINEDGYTFTNDKDSVKFTFSEFVKFLHRIENEFYGEKKAKV